MLDKHGSLKRGPPSLESALLVKNGSLERCPLSLERALGRWKADCLINMGRWKGTLCPWKADGSRIVGRWKGALGLSVAGKRIACLKWVAGKGPPSLESGLPVKNGPLEGCPASLESGWLDKNGSLERRPRSLESGVPTQNGSLERDPPFLERTLCPWKADCSIKLGRWKGGLLSLIHI